MKLVKKECAENIWYIDNFLTDEECDWHIKRSEESVSAESEQGKVGYEAAKVNVNGKQTLMTTVRNNQRVLSFDKPLAQDLWKRLSDCIPSYPFAKPIGLNELWRYYKYEKGQRFKMHRDGAYKRNDKESSFFTLIIYLNDNFKGGETGFGAFHILPKKGRAIIFKHEIKHEGKIIENGIKYVLRTDIMFQQIEK